MTLDDVPLPWIALEYLKDVISCQLFCISLAVLPTVDSEYSPIAVFDIALTLNR